MLAVTLIALTVAALAVNDVGASSPVVFHPLIFPDHRHRRTPRHTGDLSNKSHHLKSHSFHTFKLKPGHEIHQHTTDNNRTIAPKPKIDFKIHLQKTHSNHAQPTQAPASNARPESSVSTRLINPLYNHTTTNKSDATFKKPTKVPTMKPTEKPISTLKLNPTEKPTKEPNPATKSTKKPNRAMKATKKPDPAMNPTKKPNPATNPTKKPNPATNPTEKPNPATNPTKKPNPATNPTKKPNPAAKPTPTTKGTKKLNTTMPLTKKPDPTQTPTPKQRPDCAIYEGKRFDKAEWDKLYKALAKVLQNENYPPERMEVWSACKQESPNTHKEKWIAAFWDTHTAQAHSCGVKFTYNEKTGELKLTGGPACHVEGVDLCPSQMLSITQCKYPYLL